MMKKVIGWGLVGLVVLWVVWLSVSWSSPLYVQGYKIKQAKLTVPKPYQSEYVEVKLTDQLAISELESIVSRYHGINCFGSVEAVYTTDTLVFELFYLAKGSEGEAIHRWINCVSNDTAGQYYDVYFLGDGNEIFEIAQPQHFMDEIRQWIRKYQLVKVD